MDNDESVWPADLVTRGDQICGNSSCRLKIIATKQTRYFAAEIPMIS